jgi:hypothetical protein
MQTTELPENPKGAGGRTIVWPAKHYARAAKKAVRA